MWFDYIRYRYTVPVWLANSSIYINLILSNNNCSVDPTVYVHGTNELTKTTGLFTICGLYAIAIEPDIIRVKYQCVCNYGLCEYVFTYFEYEDESNVGCLELREVEIGNVSSLNWDMRPRPQVTNHLDNLINSLNKDLGNYLVISDYLLFKKK